MSGFRHTSSEPTRQHHHNHCPETGKPDSLHPIPLRDQSAVVMHFARGEIMDDYRSILDTETGELIRVIVDEDANILMPVEEGRALPEGFVLVEAPHRNDFLHLFVYSDWTENAQKKALVKQEWCAADGHYLRWMSRVPDETVAVFEEFEKREILKYAEMFLAHHGFKLS